MRAEQQTIFWNCIFTLATCTVNENIGLEALPKLLIKIKRQQLDLLHQCAGIVLAKECLQLLDLLCGHDTICSISGSDISYGSAQS